MTENSKEILGRLGALCAIHKARVQANPWPLLNRQADEINRLRNIIERANLQALGAHVCPEDSPIQPSFNDDRIRLVQVQKILGEV